MLTVTFQLHPSEEVVYLKQEEFTVNNVKKTSKYINGCKVNNDTYKRAKIIFYSQQL